MARAAFEGEGLRQGLGQGQHGQGQQREYVRLRVGTHTHARTSIPMAQLAGGARDALEGLFAERSCLSLTLVQLSCLDLPGAEQQPADQGRFSRVDVADDHDVELRRRRR